jgi:hypothetical protein
MQGVPLLQGGSEGAVQPVFEVDVALPLHRMREQVAVERGVLGQQRLEIEFPFGADELVEADLARRDLGPVAGREPVRGIGPSVAHRLEDHTPSLRGQMGPEKVSHLVGSPSGSRWSTSAPLPGRPVGESVRIRPSPGALQPRRRRPAVRRRTVPAREPS